MLYMGIYFFLLYGVANQYAALTAPHPSIPMSWEENIPFVPIFIIPYMSSDIIFIIAFFLPYTRLELRILAARIFFIVSISTIVFFLFPLEYSFHKPPIESFSILFGMLKADLPFNQLPSLHVAFAVVLWFSMKKYLHGLIRYLMLGWLWMVVISTLFVYQHHFIDLPFGAAVGLLAVYVISEERQLPFTHSFTTPRGLKMALYYIVGAAILTISAFWLQSHLSILLLWIAIAMLSVSVIYAFGLNEWLSGKEAKASWWQWVLFAPYYIGHYISWCYYRHKIPLMHQLDTNIYIGRHPSQYEYGLLQERGIVLTLNLATEQQIQRCMMPQIRLPFLDQTIQSPQYLHKGVMLIEQHLNKPIYIHCALGMSRTILLASAWLVYRGYSVESAQNIVRKARPMYVASPYMQLTLEIYEEYINSLKR